MNRETAIRLLLLNNIIEGVEPKYDSRASVAMFSITNRHNDKVTHSLRYASLRTSKNTLIGLYNNTKSYITRNYISALYTLGIGVPKDRDCAAFWKSQSYGVCKCQSYKEYRRKLKLHIQEACKNSYYVYTKDVNKQQRLLELIDKNEEKDSEKCAIVYKNSIEGYRFHNLVINGESLMFEINPKQIGAETIIGTNQSNTETEIDTKLESVNSATVKYVVRLGHIKKRETYNFKRDVNVIFAKIASDPTCSKEDVGKFLERICFECINTVLIDYRGKVTQYKVREKYANFNKKAS